MLDAEILEQHGRMSYHLKCIKQHLQSVELSPHLRNDPEMMEWILEQIQRCVDDSQSKNDGMDFTGCTFEKKD